MNSTPIIKDTCLLCGDGMTDDCTLCFKRPVGRIIPNPDKRKWFDPSLCVVVLLIMIFAVAWLFVLDGLFPHDPKPTPAPALSTQALYESQIRDLTHEIHAREIQLDTLVRALETTAAERDAALNLLSQIRRGKGL